MFVKIIPLSILLTALLLGMVGSTLAQCTGASVSYVATPVTLYNGNPGFNLVAVPSGFNGPVNYTWTTTYGNGFTYTTNDRVRRYVSPGQVFCLTVADSLNCTVTICDSVFAGTPACANFSASASSTITSYSTNTASFNSQVTGGSGNYDYLWTFDNQASNPPTSTLANPTYTYGSNSYQFQVAYLDVFDNVNHCYAYTTDTVDFGTCTTSFAYTTSGNTASLMATGNSIGSADYYWTITDAVTGAISYPSGQNISHTFSGASGAHYACVTMYDSLANCQATYCDTIVTNGSGTNPCANASTNFFPVIQGNNATLYATAIGLDSATTTFMWNFGAVGPTAQFTLSPGANVICLTASDSFCTVTYCDTIYHNNINPCANVSASFWDTLYQGTTYLYATANGFTNPAYSWSFGATGSIAQANLPTGWNMVCLTVYDSLCQYTYCDSVYVGGGGSGCNDHLVTLTLNHDNYGGETSWDVVDVSGNIVASGQSSFALSNSTTYEDLCLPAGCYTLNVYDSWGDGMCCAYGVGGYNLSDSAGTFSISGGQFSYVDSRNFCVGGATPPCGNIQYTTISHTLGANGTATYSYNTTGNVQPIIFNWLVDGVSASTSANPTLSFSNGVHSVCLIATDSSGVCSVTVCDSILITNANTGGQGCAGIVADMNVYQDSTNPYQLYVQPVLNNAPANSSFIFYWSFGDNSGAFGGQANHTYNNYGSYNLCYVAIDSLAGCIVNYCDTITLDSMGNFSRFINKPGFNMTTLPPVINTILTTDQLATTAWDARLFPNPVANQLNLEINSQDMLEGQVRIVSAAGQVVQQYSLNQAGGVMELSVANLPQGVYFVRVDTEQEQRTLKFVKK